MRAQLAGARALKNPVGPVTHRYVSIFANPVINAVLMAPRFQFHARPAHHRACFPRFSARFRLLFGRWLISRSEPHPFPSGAEWKTSRERRLGCQRRPFVFNIRFNLADRLYDMCTYYLHMKAQKGNRKQRETDIWFLTHKKSCNSMYLSVEKK